MIQKISSVQVWGLVSGLEPNPIPSLTSLPKGKVDSITELIHHLKFEYFQFEQELKFILEDCTLVKQKEDKYYYKKEDRKEISLYFQKFPYRKSLLFKMLDNKEITKEIWEKVKPDFRYL